LFMHTTTKVNPVLWLHLTVIRLIDSAGFKLIATILINSV
jgi:hypothetical protein